MTHFIRIVRTLSTVVLALAFTTMVGCSGDPGDGGDGGDGGSGQGGNGPGDSGAGAGSNTTSGSSTGSGMIGIDWKGTWSAQLTYTASCDYGFGDVWTAKWDQTNTIQISDDGNGGLLAQFPSDVNYGMSGTGNDNGLTLSGQYPAKDEKGEPASVAPTENNVTVKLDTIMGANGASGTVSGTYHGQFAQKCTIEDGIAVFSR